MGDDQLVSAVAECNVDPYERRKFVVNPDGTLTRLLELPTTAANEELPDSAVFTKDEPLNTTKNTWLRIFQPKQLPPFPPTKLPVVIYYHGGGFIVGSAAWSIFHNFCSNMSAQLPALVVSVEYRLAPEHRLPVAYEDAIEAIHWLRNQTQLAAVADLARCFLMGDSAGGNIAYHAGLRAATMIHEIEPVKIAGIIMHQPFFGGVERTESELRLINDQSLPLSGNDLMWELSLPLGSNRDHCYCNPMMVDDGEEGIPVRLLKRCLVTGSDGDPLVDRQRMFVKMLEEKGIDVVARFQEGGCHGQEHFDPNSAQNLFMLVANFISSSSSSVS